MGHKVCGHIADIRGKKECKERSKSFTSFQIIVLKKVNMLLLDKLLLENTFPHLYNNV